ncbi:MULTISPECIES: (2Fe-2S)-binding protein [unclassified Neptuniibacter]|uniref:(2Fe-2S)-binding protein n=1 Tax=unclassified Neptuniibacter TaxID=2630693 RepID=UPI000C5DC2D5|nr:MULTISPECIES: (2Fe-2S)-binding protein [unclassified Neptuniibacter]MAY40809.1 hypothetical protein [Oceanospirillaceae bacterium]
MNIDRKDADPTLVCTCNDLYISDIEESIDFGEDEYREIFAVHDLQPRCGECVNHVNDIVKQKNPRCD